MSRSRLVMGAFLFCLGSPSWSLTATVGAPPVSTIAPETVGFDAVVREVIRAFDTADIVALGEAHQRRQDSELRIALIRSPDFVRQVRTIVVEFGNARYQPMLDRYVRGDEITVDQLQPLWRDTTQLQVWDSPLYEEFFRAVRETNRTLAPTRQLRVLAGDPPIDWTAIHDPISVERFLAERDSYAASVIRNEVLAKGEKALVLYGIGHVLRNGGLTASSSPPQRRRCMWS